MSAGCLNTKCQGRVTDILVMIYQAFASSVTAIIKESSDVNANAAFQKVLTLCDTSAGQKLNGGKCTRCM